jgi:hypothetical protein
LNNGFPYEKPIQVNEKIQSILAVLSKPIKICPMKSSIGLYPALFILYSLGHQATGNHGSGQAGAGMRTGPHEI